MTDLELIERSLETGVRVELVVTRALYNCCGRGWQERAGYEQTYRGTLRRGAGAGGLVMLTAAGIGTISYFVLIDPEHVVDATVAPE